MRWLITGGGGLLGSALSKVLSYENKEYKAFQKSELDVTDLYTTKCCIEAEDPDVVLHCAAFTDVDEAESERKASFEVNSVGAHNVAEICRSVGARMVFFSTDYVFSGNESIPYSPNENPSPISLYGESKLAGEKNVIASGVDLLLIRTSWLYGAVGRGFVPTVIKRAHEGRGLRLVADQIGSPTWAMNVARAAIDLVSYEASGIYHLSDAGETSWYEFGEQILSILGIKAKIEPISSEAWGAPAARPRYSVLDSTKAEELLGRRMTPWREALKTFLKEEFK